MKDTIYAQVKRSGIEYWNHEGDLYVPVNDYTRALVEAYEYKSNVTTFRMYGDGILCYDIPFAYLPYWEGKVRCQTNTIR